MASPVPAEDDNIDEDNDFNEDDLQQAGIKLVEFDSEDDSDGDYDEFEDDQEEELHREAEKRPKLQTGSKYMKGGIFRKKLDDLIMAGELKAKDPVVRLLYDYGFNGLPDWDVSTAKELQEEVASALAASCDFQDDIEIDKLDPCERGLAECVKRHLEIQETHGSIVPSSLDPVLKKLTPQQWARQMSTYITEQRWREVFDYNLEELPDITQYLSHEPLTTERGVYVAMLIAKDDTQHNHLYAGSGVGERGIRGRQQDRQRKFDGKGAPVLYFEKLMCQKDPTTQAHVRDFPLWGCPLQIPDAEFDRYTRALFMAVLVHLAEAVVALRLSGYDGRIKAEGVQALCRLGLNCPRQPWRGTLQHCPLMDGVSIPWPEGVRKALRVAYLTQYSQDNRDRIKAKYDRLAGTFPCEADPGCRKTFASASASRQHIHVCRGQLEYSCVLGCGSSSDSPEKMLRHARDWCKYSSSRISVFCPRGCGAKFCESRGAKAHANSAACIFFNREDLLGIQCPRGCGSRPFDSPLRAVRHANTGNCPKYTIAWTAVVESGAAVLVPGIGQAREPDLPEVHNDGALQRIKSFLGSLGEDEDLVRWYVDVCGGGGMDELVGRYTAELDDK